MGTASALTITSSFYQVNDYDHIRTTCFSAAGCTVNLRWSVDGGTNVDLTESITVTAGSTTSSSTAIKAKWLSVSYTVAAQPSALRATNLLFQEPASLGQLANTGSGAQIYKVSEQKVRSVISSDNSLTVTQLTNEIDAKVSSTAIVAANNDVQVTHGPAGYTIDIGSCASGAVVITNGLSDGLNGINSTAIGPYAGITTQGQDCVAVGFHAGQITQQNSSTAVGSYAGNDNQAENCVAIGRYTGRISQQIRATSVGSLAGQYTQGSQSVAIGYQAGETGQGANSICIGYKAGQNLHSSESISIGFFAGQTGIGTETVAIGGGAGGTNMGNSSIAIGRYAGTTGMGANSVAVGREAGRYNQGPQSVGIGYAAGMTGQGQYCVANGYFAGGNYQSDFSVAVGGGCALTGQGTSCVAVGYQSGRYNQGAGAAAVGNNSGYTGQGVNAVAFGNAAGFTLQGQVGIAIGYRSGYDRQGLGGICIGSHNVPATTSTSQPVDSVQIGRDCKVPGAVGRICFGAYMEAVQNTATAGAQTLPANPVGFMRMEYNGTLYKVPLYSD